MKKFPRRFHLFCFCILATIPPAGGAAAASITNLDAIPYDIHIRTGGDVQEVHIEPGRTWVSSGYQTSVRYRDNWMNLNQDSSYAIWKGGSIVEQRAGPMAQGKR